MSFSDHRFPSRAPDHDREPDHDHNRVTDTDHVHALDALHDPDTDPDPDPDLDPDLDVIKCPLRIIAPYLSNKEGRAAECDPARTGPIWFAREARPGGGRHRRRC